MADLVIHVLGVVGGSLAISQMPGRGGDYAADLDFIRDWKPSLVITATTRGELADVGAESLGADILESGARWLHLPITDYGVPDALFLQAWPAASEAALSALRGRGRVLIHCKGGCGRSGMLALRLMVQSGEEAVQALLRLRKLRPCAVETDPQLRWAVTGILPQGD
ncbi:protein-tyrosine phosphatase family protein [Planktotalea arctica]|uniref:phosphatase domain-containing protein n=1 Tax=Planktotalea arctica TaxID=1481893 RepID=UPI000A171A06|nr:protein-tyrosine phosphatase family protein [Planktotalea arctica]